MRPPSFSAVACATPAFAQADFSGHWAPLFHEDRPERLPGPELGDYLGIPLSEAGRLRADSYDADRISVVQEYQCRPHAGDYMMRGLANMRVDAIRDPVTNRLTAYHLRMGFQEMERTIYLDGRPRPSPNAPYTWSGFSVGTWQDNVLNIYTTHLKENYIRRNGIPASDKRTFTEHWVRHGNYLTVQTVITDPVILTEPLVRSQTWVLDPTQQMGRDICETAPEVPSARRRRSEPPPGHQPVSARGRGLVRPALRRDARRRRNDVPGVPKDDGQAGDPAARDLRAVLQLRPERRRLQPPVAEQPMRRSISRRSRRRGPAWPPRRSRSRAQQPPAGAAAPALETLRVQRNVYAIFGAGGNVTVQIGDEGVLVVDSGLAASAGALIAEIRKLSTRPIRFLINTHVHPDHVGGNVAFSPAPVDPRPDFSGTAGARGCRSAAAAQHHRARTRAEAHDRGAPAARSPGSWAAPSGFAACRSTSTSCRSKDMHFNGEAVVLYHEPNAHTDGDSFVLFRGSDVVSAGDIFTPGGYPFIDIANGGSVQGEIAALNHLLQLTVPAHTAGRRHLRRARPRPHLATKPTSSSSAT